MGGAEDPRLVRSHLFRRLAQGWDAGGIEAPGAGSRAAGQVLVRSLRQQDLLPLVTEVARKSLELGIAQASEIVPHAGAQLVGPLPGELGSMTQFSGGIGAESASANASKALIDFLAGQEAGSHFKAKGFEPGG